MKKLFAFLRDSVVPNARNVMFQTFVPLTPGLGSGGPPRLLSAIQQADMAGFLQAVFNIAISVGAILAVLRIGWGGFKYMTTDAIGSKSDAKKIITDAVIGLLLLLAIVLIIGRINPNLLKMNLNLDKTGGGASTPAAKNAFDGRVRP